MRKYILTLAGFLLFLAVVIIILLTFKNSTVEISSPRFANMIAHKQIQEIVVVINQNIAEITLTEEALLLPEYQNELRERSWFFNQSPPHYHLKILDEQFFQAELYSLQLKMSSEDRISYTTEVRPDFANFLFKWSFLIYSLFLLLVLSTVILLFIFLFRRVFIKPKAVTNSEHSKIVSKSNGYPVQKSLKNFPLKLNDRVSFIPIENIACFYAQDNHVYLYDTKGKEHLVEYTLADLEAKLPKQFIRVHRSTIINSHLIQEVKKQPGSRFIIKLRDTQQKEILTGQSYAAPVKQLLEI